MFIPKNSVPEITDGQARRIAKRFAKREHRSYNGALRRFATSGRIPDFSLYEHGTTTRLLDSISWIEYHLPFDGDRPQDSAELYALYQYVQQTGPRESVPCWREMWDNTPIPPRDEAKMDPSILASFEDA